MRRRYLAILLVVLVAGWAFASGQSEMSSESGSEPAEVMRIRFATILAPGDPMAEAGERFAELVSEKSGGTIEVETYPGGALGGERDNLEALRTGSLEVAGVSSLADAIFFAPEYSVFSAAYLIKDRDHLRRAWAGEVGQEINSHIEETLGIKTLTLMDRGPRQLTSNVRVDSVEDVQGLKMRVPNNQVYLEIWEALGANPVPVAFPELYGALQTGVVGAQENPLATIYSSKFYEVQDYLALTNHVIEAYKFQTSKRWFDRLTPEQQEIIQSAAVEAAEYGNELVRQSEEQLVGELESLGMTIVEPDIESFRQKAMPKVLELGETYFKPGLVEKVLEIADE